MKKNSTPKPARPKKERPPDQYAMDTGWRLFVAIPVPPEVKVLMAGIINYIDGKDWPVRWSNTETLHLTLHFLGDTEPERAELLRHALPKVIAQHEPFTLQTGQVGVFPYPAAPRVLWLGLAGQVQALAELNASIAETLKSLDFPVENRPLRPHLTLGRARDEVPADFPQMVQEKLLDPRLQERLSRSAVVIPVNEVGLMRSYLGKFGVKYVPVFVTKLVGSE